MRIRSTGTALFWGILPRAQAKHITIDKHVNSGDSCCLTRLDRGGVHFHIGERLWQDGVRALEDRHAWSNQACGVANVTIGVQEVRAE